MGEPVCRPLDVVAALEAVGMSEELVDKFDAATEPVSAVPTEPVSAVPLEVPGAAHAVGPLLLDAPLSSELPRLSPIMCVLLPPCCCTTLLCSVCQ